MSVLATGRTFLIGAGVALVAVLALMSQGTSDTTASPASPSLGGDDGVVGYGLDVTAVAALLGCVRFDSASLTGQLEFAWAGMPSSGAGQCQLAEGSAPFSIVTFADAAQQDRAEDFLQVETRRDLSRSARGIGAEVDGFVLASGPGLAMIATREAFSDVVSAARQLGLTAALITDSGGARLS